MGQYFPKPCEPFSGDVNVTWYLIMQQRMILKILLT